MVFLFFGRAAAMEVFCPDGAAQTLWAPPTAAVVDGKVHGFGFSDVGQAGHDLHHICITSASSATCASPTQYIAQISGLGHMLYVSCGILHNAMWKRVLQITRIVPCQSTTSVLINPGTRMVTALCRSLLAAQS